MADPQPQAKVQLEMWPFLQHKPIHMLSRGTGVEATAERRLAPLLLLVLRGRMLKRQPARMPQPASVVHQHEAQAFWTAGGKDGRFPLAHNSPPALVVCKSSSVSGFGTFDYFCVFHFVGTVSPAWSLESTCLNLPKTEITGVHHHAGFLCVFSWYGYKLT